MQQHFLNAEQGKGATKAKQEQGMVVMESLSPPLEVQEFTDMCWKFQDLGCLFLHSIGIASGGY